MFQVAYLVTSTLIGPNLRTIGRKNAMMGGYIAILLATIGFGLLTYINKE